VTVAEFAALGTVALAVVTYTANLVLDRRNKVAIRRSEAYTDFLTGVSRASNIADKNSKEFREADVSILEAKHRIILCGSSRVVRELVELLDGDPRFALTEQGRRQ